MRAGRASGKLLAALVLTGSALAGCGVDTQRDASVSKALADSRAEATPTAATADERMRQSCLTSSANANGGSGATWPSLHTADASVVSERHEGLSDMAPIARDATANVRGVLKRTSRHSLLVLLPHTETQYQQWAHQPSEGKLAETVTRPGCLPYIVISPDLAGKPTSFVLRETVTHEAVHALTLTSVAAKRPRWVVEGMAEYIGQKSFPLPGHPSAQAQARIPTDADLAGADAPVAYDEAWLFYRHLAATYSEAKAVAFYRDSVSSVKPLDAVARAHFGKSLAELESAYRSGSEAPAASK